MSGSGNRRSALRGGVARLRGLSLPVRVGIALAVVLLLVAGVSLVVNGSSEVGGRVAAARATDRVPAGPTIRKIPFDCGVSQATVDRFAPGAEKQETESGGHDSCTWRVGDTAWQGHSARELDVKLDTSVGDPDVSGSTTADAVQSFSRTLRTELKPSDTRKPGMARAVTGLGHEALAWHFVTMKVPADSPDGHRRPWSSGTTVVFRAGNVSGTVTYTGSDHPDTRGSRPRPLATATTRRGALRTATRVARALKLPVRGTPAVTAAEPDGRPIRGVPHACDLVSRAALTAIDEPHARTKRDPLSVFGDDSAPSVDGNSCEVAGESRMALNVHVGVFADARTGSGSSAAIRRFLVGYHQAREMYSDSTEQTFSALRAPGDQVYMLYKRGSGPDDADAVVEFRVRNVLVRVTCSSIDGISPDDGLNHAYTVALAAAKKVRS